MSLVNLTLKKVEYLLVPIFLTVHLFYQDYLSNFVVAVVVVAFA